MIHRLVFPFAAASVLCLGSAVAAQGELELQVGSAKFRLPAVGAPADPAAPAPPVDPATLAVVEAWRPFAWDADRKKYRYRFAVAANSSAALALTPDGSAGELAKSLDAAAARVAECVGAEALRKDAVAILCATQDEYERAAAFTRERALERVTDPVVAAHLRDSWLATAAKSPTFYEQHACVVGCIGGNSEKWSPEHELVRGYAVVALLDRAPLLWHALPVLIGLSWNVENDVTGDILSMPYGDEFQFDIGRGTWSASKLAAAFKKAAKQSEQEHGRAAALRDLPYLDRGAGSTADGAAMAWALGRHLLRHHGERLPDFLAALSAEVVARNTQPQGDGSTRFVIPPGYQLGWEPIESVLAATIADWRHEAFAGCAGTACADCKAWARARGIR